MHYCEFPGSQAVSLYYLEYCTLLLFAFYFLILLARVIQFLLKNVVFFDQGAIYLMFSNVPIQNNT